MSAHFIALFNAQSGAGQGLPLASLKSTKVWDSLYFIGGNMEAQDGKGIAEGVSAGLGTGRLGQPPSPAPGPRNVSPAGEEPMPTPPPRSGLRQLPTLPTASVSSYTKIGSIINARCFSEAGDGRTPPHTM